MNTIRLSVLALAALLTPLLALSQDNGRPGASPAAAVAPGAAPAKPAAVKAKKKARGKPAAKKGASLKEQGEKIEQERRRKRGGRLAEKGEALGGGKEGRIEADVKKMEAQRDRDKKHGAARKKRGASPQHHAGRK